MPAGACDGGAVNPAHSLLKNVSRDLISGQVAPFITISQRMTYRLNKTRLDQSFPAQSGVYCQPMGAKYTGPR